MNLLLSNKVTTKYWGRSYGPNFWSDDYFLEQCEEAAETTDVVKQTAIFKDLAVYYLESACIIPFPCPYIINAYWPWLKNYYGEVETAYVNRTAITARLWIDQSMKVEMGY